MNTLHAPETLTLGPTVYRIDAAGRVFASFDGGPEAHLDAYTLRIARAYLATADAAANTTEAARGPLREAERILSDQLRTATSVQASAVGARPAAVRVAAVAYASHLDRR